MTDRHIDSLGYSGVALMGYKAGPGLPKPLQSFFSLFPVFWKLKQREKGKKSAIQKFSKRPS
jgi:hypothetical protein